MKTGRKRAKTKILSLLLVLAMCASLLPAAHAEDLWQEDVQRAAESADVEAAVFSEADVPGEAGTGAAAEPDEPAAVPEEDPEPAVDPAEQVPTGSETEPALPETEKELAEPTEVPEGRDEGETSTPEPEIEAGEEPGAPGTETDPTDPDPDGEREPDEGREPGKDEEGDPVEEAEDTEGEKAEDADSEDSKDEEPGSIFPGFPEDYELSAAELAAKQALTVHGTVDALSDCAFEEGVVLLVTESPEYAEMAAEAFGAQVLSFDGFFARLGLPEGATVAEAVTSAADLSLRLPAVEPDWLVGLEPGYGSFSVYSAQAATADEPLDWYDWVKSLGLNDTYIQNPSWNYQWMHDAVNSYAAWGVTMGRPEITVAVLDTGVYAAHEDLGIILSGWNTMTDTDDINDDSGHGTHVAGILAAQGFNARGGVGIAPQVSILPVRVLSSSGGTNSTVAKGINWAVENGADIINLSLGGTAYSSTVEKAVNNAWKNGVTVIAAMCNSAYGGSNIQHYPAAYDHVIAVSATDESGNLASYSHYGTWCDVLAPGSNIMSTWIRNGYRSDSGTSMATPVVSGAAALYMSAYGKQSPDVMEALLRGATTNGVLDLAKLMGGDLSAPLILVGEEGRVLTSATAKLTSADTLRVVSGTQDDGCRIVYTLDGTKPAMLNGEVRNGMLLEAGETVSLAEYAVGTTLTLRAIKVNGMGAAGKEAKLKIIIETPATEEERGQIHVEITEQPGSHVVAGKSITLKAAVISELGTSVDQKVTWRIDGQDAGLGAKINAAKGILTTKAGKSGSVQVSAVSTAYPELSASTVIQVRVISAVKTATMSEKTLTLNCPDGEETRLTVKYLDASGRRVDPAEIGVVWRSSNAKVVTVDGNGTLTPVGKGTANVTATAQDGSGKSATCRVTVRQLVTEISLSGSPVVTTGGNAKFTAAVSPATANNKAVVWSIGERSDPKLSVTVSASGQVRVGGTATAGSWFELIAEAKDGSGTRSEPLTVTVTGKATQLVLSPAEVPTVPILDRNGNLTGAVLWLRSAENESITLDAFRRYKAADGSTVNDPSGILWSSSNRKVAETDALGNVTAAGPGSAVITAKAADGSGRSARFTVRVIRPVSSLSLSSGAPGGSQFLAYGKSVSVRAAVGSTWGRPDNPKLIWSFTAAGENGIFTEDLAEVLRENRLVSLSSSGVLSVKEKARDYNLTGLMVTAETTDGTELQDSLSFEIGEPTTAISLEEFLIEDGVLKLYGNPGTVDLSLNNRSGSSAHLCIVSDGLCETFSVSSSRPEVAGAYVNRRYYSSRDGRQSYMSLELVSGMKTGTAVITVKACDGSGKTASVTVKVS